MWVENKLWANLSSGRKKAKNFLIGLGIRNCKPKESKNSSLCESE